MFRINMGKKPRVSIVVFLCLFIAPGTLHAYWPELARLTPSDGDPNDHFGCSISTSGDYVIVGAYLDDEKGTDAGAAYIFNTDGTSWTQKAKLTASDAAAGHHFGNSVSIDGFYAIVGSPHSDSNEPNSGAAYVFLRTFKYIPGQGFVEIWEEQAKLTSSDARTGDEFGFSVSISKDWAIVGAPKPNSVRGSAYIYQRNETTWTQNSRFTQPDDMLPIISNFGVSVSISGGYAVVGSSQWQTTLIPPSTSGRAFFLKRKFKIVLPDDIIFYWEWDDNIGTVDGFGTSVSINADLAVVGSPGDRLVYPLVTLYFGAGHVYKYIESNWLEQGKLLLGGRTPADKLGQSVCVFGDYAVVGAPGRDDNGHNAGAACIFRPVGTMWMEIARLLASDGNVDDGFGSSVAISADYVVVGAPGDDDSGTDSGSAYVFKVCPITDLNYDCSTNFMDFAILADQWLQ